MLSQISSSLDSPTTEVSSSVTVNSSSVNANSTAIQSKNPRYKGLKPYKKGQSGNPSGKPKDSISLRPIMSKRLKKKQAEDVVDSIIRGAVAGDDSKQDRLLKLTGDLNAPQLASSTNTYNLIITPELINIARQFLNDRNIQPSGTIVDVNSVLLPVSSSIE